MIVEIERLEVETNIRRPDGSWKTKAEVMYEIALHTDKDYNISSQTNRIYEILKQSGIIQEEK